MCLTRFPIDGISERPGWVFVNGSHCADFLRDGGSILNIKTRDLSTNDDLGGEQAGCEAHWDSFLCWPPARPNTRLSQPCPQHIVGVIKNNYAGRICGPGGWLDRRGAVSPNTTFTNFTNCFTEHMFKDVNMFLNESEETRELKMWVLDTSGSLELVGHSVSLLSLLLSILILSSFRSLRTQEKKIHLHLYIAMLVQVAMRLVFHLEEREMKGTTREELVLGSVLAWRGFARTEIVCNIVYILLEYTKTATFHWMFLEGLHMHNILVVNVFLVNSNRNHTLYLLVGWLLPLLSVSTWAIVTQNTLHSHCWFGYSHESFYWISEGPRLGIIILNFLFLVNILRMLRTKAGPGSQTNETNFVRASIKAAIVLQPLLGITNFLQIVNSPYGAHVYYFTFWSFTTTILSSFQGFFASLFYCFCNREVQKVLTSGLVLYKSRRQTINSLPARVDSLHSRSRSCRRQPPPLWTLEPVCGQLNGGNGGGGGKGGGSEWAPRGRSISIRQTGKSLAVTDIQIKSPVKDSSLQHESRL